MCESTEGDSRAFAAFGASPHAADVVLQGISIVQTVSNGIYETYLTGIQVKGGPRGPNQHDTYSKQHKGSKSNVLCHEGISGTLLPPDTELPLERFFMVDLVW